MPAILNNGISYSDFWQMTIREIRDFSEFIIKKEKCQRECEKILVERQEKHDLFCAAMSAYYSALYGRIQPNYFPNTIAQAFPKLFGLDENGQIPAENWQAGKERMLAILERHNSAIDRKAANNK